MRGFITIDRQPGSDAVALWATSRSDKTPNHVNAVVTDLAEDRDALWKIRTLTRDAAVVITDGSDPAGLPLDALPHTMADMKRLCDATRTLQQQIVSAIDAYAMMPSPKTGKPPKSPRKLVYPEFADSPQQPDFVPCDDTPQQRALAGADYVRAAWRFWVDAEEQRRQRIRSPKGVTPWMMPAELGAAEVTVLPATFLASLRVESLSVHPWAKMSK